MSRQRWFCSFCGGLTERPPDTRDGKVRCRGHAALPVETDLIPPDPGEILPTMAASETSASPGVQAVREQA